MNPIIFESTSLADTDRLGAALAAELPPRTVIALSGTLGAGKTRLVQAIAAACGIDREEVVSPTFVLCQQYVGSRVIYHLDAYRLHDEDEFLELGVEEYLTSDAVTIIEWAEKVVGCLPPERVEIEIVVSGPDSRQFVIRSVGSPLQEFHARLAERLES